MKKNIISIIIALVFILGMLGCSQNKETMVENTFEETSFDLIEEHIKNSKEVIKTTYREMSDGTFKTDEYTYKHKLIITGRMNNAVCDTTYTILSNTEDISFEQAWKASGLSSNMDNYFKTEDAVFVATKLG